MKKQPAFWKARIADNYHDWIVPSVEEELPFSMDFGTSSSIVDSPQNLHDVLRGMFPLTSQPEPWVRLDYLSYQLDQPELSEQECREMGETFLVPLRGVFRLSVWEGDEHASKPVISDMYEQEIWLGSIPCMTVGSTFIYNGVECLARLEESDSSVGESLVSFLAEGFAKVVQTTQKRLQAAWERSLTRTYGLDVMPHDLFSTGPIATKVRRWFQRYMTPLAVHNPIAQVVQLHHSLPSSERSTLNLAGILPSSVRDTGPRLSDAAALLSAEPASLWPGDSCETAHHALTHILAPFSGTVSDVTEFCIVVEPNEPSFSGESNLWPVALPLRSVLDGQQPSYQHSVLVEAGQHVQQGDLLAVGPGMINDKLALGHNIQVAFVAMDNSEFAEANKQLLCFLSPELQDRGIFTSQRFHTFAYERKTSELLQVDSQVLSNAAMTYDSTGVIQVGSEVEEGDVLVHATEVSESLRSPLGVTGSVVSVQFVATHPESSKQSPARSYCQQRNKETLTSLLQSMKRVMGSFLDEELDGQTLAYNFIGDDGAIKLSKGTLLSKELLVSLLVHEKFSLALSTSEAMNDSSLEVRMQQIQRRWEDQLFYLQEMYHPTLQSRASRSKKKPAEQGRIVLASEGSLQEGDVLFTQQGLSASVVTNGSRAAILASVLDQVNAQQSDSAECIFLVPDVNDLPASLLGDSVTAPSVFVEQLACIAEVRIATAYLMKQHHWRSSRQ